MKVTNFANLFHQSSVFQQGKPLGQKLVQPAVSDVLRRVSENLSAAQEQDLKKRFDRLELSAEAAGSRENSALSEMPDEMLELYLNQYKVAANLSQQNEASLTEYRDQISAFDQTIQEYQDMLDGKAELPGMMNTEDVSMLLERTRAAREQFLREGAKELNRIGREGPALDDKSIQMAAGSAGVRHSDFQWSIDASAEDIYAEIDRALAFVQRGTSLCRDGASRVAAELRRRGREAEGVSLEPQDGPVQRGSLFQGIYDGLWAAFRQGAWESDA